MQVVVEPFNFLLLPANIQCFSVLINGQLSRGCRFDALRDLGGVCKTRNTPEHPRNIPGTPLEQPGTAGTTPEHPWNIP